MSDVRLLLASQLGEREVVAFRPALARELGAIPALFLCQACYWQGIAGADEWWYKLRNADRDANGLMVPPDNASRQSWEWELGLTRAEQEGARKILCQHGLLEERLKGVPAKLHYRVNLDRLFEFLLNNQQMAGFNQLDGEIQPTGWWDSTSKPGRIPPAITETTSEISSSTTNHPVVDRNMEELIEAAVWSESLSRPIKNEVGFRVRKRQRLHEHGPSAEDLVALSAWRANQKRLAAEKEKAAKKERERETAEIQRAKNAERAARAQEYFNSLDDATRSSLLQRFGEHLNATQSHAFQMYRRTGLEGELVRRALWSYLEKSEAHPGIGKIMSPIAPIFDTTSSPTMTG